MSQESNTQSPKTVKDIAHLLPASVLTRGQKKVFGPKPIAGWGRGAKITAHVRFDDECKNGHNTFAITGEIRIPGHTDIEAGGCLHEEIAKSFPELAPLIKWHLVDADGPWGYIENTTYHASEHGPTHAWVYYKGDATDPLKLGDDSKGRLLGYLEADKAKVSEGKEGYTIKWNQDTAKNQDLDAARNSAVWPEATDEQLRLPKEELTKLLLDRLPALMAEFKAAVESLGFTY